jgi:TonB family protein
MSLLVVMAHCPTAKASDRPTVYVDASFVKDFVVAPVPNYPMEALEKKWGGLGVFELRFRPDGTVKDVVTLMTTDHELLDQTARSALRQWRCKPGTSSSGRLTMLFSVRHGTINVAPDEALKEIPVHPYPTYPKEAVRRGWAGTGLFIMRFRPDGTVKQVVALKSTDNPVLDDACVRTLLRWRSVPGACRTAKVPVTFTLRG